MKIRENESVTGFTIRRMHNEIVETCAKLAEDYAKVCSGLDGATAGQEIASMIRRLSDD